MSKFLDTCGDVFSTIKFEGQKHLPEGLVIFGVTGLVAAGVLACKATLKAPQLAEKSQVKIEEVKAKFADELITEKEYKRELTKSYAMISLEWAKLYAPSVIIASLSAGAIFSSTDILKKRNASLAAAYATLDGAFKKYRKNVVNKYGEDEDIRMLTGAKEETITVEEVDENGKTKKVKQKVNAIDPDDVENWNSYARIFGNFPIGSIHHTNYFCKNDPTGDYNVTLLSATEKFLDDKLNREKRPFVSLNDLYDELGYERTVAGQHVGWTRNSGKGDGHVNLRINDKFFYYETDPETGKRNLVRGILIDPNCEGYVLDNKKIRKI